MDNEKIEAMIAAYKSGVVSKPNEKNPRGFTVYYDPKNAMRAALHIATANMVPLAVPDEYAGLVEGMADRLRAAQDYYDEVHIEMPSWLCEHRAAMTAIQSLTSTVADLERQLAEAREAMPRLDTGMVEAAMRAHYGKDALGITGVDLTAHGVNWTFEQGFRRMWAGVRKELKRRAQLARQGD